MQGARSDVHTYGLMHLAKNRALLPVFAVLIFGAEVSCQHSCREMAPPHHAAKIPTAHCNVLGSTGMGHGSMGQSTGCPPHLPPPPSPGGPCVRHHLP